MKRTALVLSVLLFASSQIIAGDLRHLLPRPKASFEHSSSFILSNSTPIVIADDADSVTIRAALYLQNRFQLLFAKSVQIQHSSQYSGGNAIIIGVQNHVSKLTNAVAARLIRGEDLSHPEGYVLDVDAANAILVGTDSNGVFNGISTIVQLTNAVSGSVIIAGVHVYDYPDYSARWVFSTHNLLVGSSVSFLKAMSDTMALYKLNGLQQNDFKYSILQTQGINYFWNIDTLKRSMLAHNIDIIPGVIGLGWSDGILYNDPNLAEGLHAVSTYIVEADTGRLIPDTRMTIPNGGFESYNSNGIFSGWGFYDGPNQSTFVDTTVFHSGKASARCTNFAAGNAGGNCRFEVKLNCDSSGYYILSAYIKTENFINGYLQLLAIGGDDNRALTFTALAVPSTADWTRVEVTFNTLGNRSVLLYVGNWGGGSGTFWVDDFNVKPGGLCNILRRDGTPLVVRNKNTGLVYFEGSDFAPVADQKLNNSYGSYFPYHTPPTFRRMANAILHNGDTITISYYHPFASISDNTGNGSVMACVSEDTLYSILRDQVSRVNNLYQPPTFFMGHDEIRNMNHDVICLARNESPSALLSDNITKCHDLIRTISPKSDILMWSDMVDSLHNAHNNYYLINGDLTGDWLNIPKDITIINWNGGLASKSLNFFANYGFKQISSPYYDVGNTSTIRSWRLAQEGVKNIRGMMYTTWANDYRFVGPFAYYAWGAGPNIIHTPLDTSVLSMVKIPISAEVYPDPYDATDAITYVSVSIFDSTATLLTRVKLDSVGSSKYQSLIPNAYQSGFEYSIEATNKQGLTKTSPRYIIGNNGIVSATVGTLTVEPNSVNISGAVGGHYTSMVVLMDTAFVCDTITSIMLSQIDTLFSIKPTTFPIILCGGGDSTLTIYYNPVSPSFPNNDTASLWIHYKNGGDHLVRVVITGFSFKSSVTPMRTSDDLMVVTANPFTEETTLELKNASPTAKITLTDILGNVITLPYSDHIMINAKQLGLHEGIYVLRVQDAGVSILQNIICLSP
ncbi:MAG TPA: glycoside hydrolase family 20 zincin-like fold domain-containing protein [Candidatus Kapabacteria bacterium]|nr:glycoside hydrolase family 20 zincin-like fold domain-containing protein [Candidatus Kapabacteria bacterium]